MSRILQKKLKLHSVISFGLMFAMVVTMLPLFGMPKVYAASTPEIIIDDFVRVGNSYKITDISFENFDYGNISAITFSTNNSSNEIRVTLHQR